MKTLVDRRARGVIAPQIMLICVNQSYCPTMTDRQKYNKTRGSWKVDRRRAAKARLALAVVKGKVVAAFAIDSWRFGPPKGRSVFVGHKAAPSDRQKYVGLDVRERFRRGAQWPTRYVPEDELA